jgi:DNA mismatch repair protein MutS2
MIDQHSLTTLEFSKVIDRIAGKCLTPHGPEQVRAFQPMTDRALIERRSTEITQMKDIVNFGDAFPLWRIEDCRELLAQARIQGHYLDPKQFRTLLQLVEISIDLHGYHREGRDNFPQLAEHLQHVRAFPELKTEITRAIDDDGEIRDSASPALKKIRADLHDSRRTIVARMRKILGEHQKQAGWQDDVVTQRSGRYVIPVPSNQYRGDMGILHDRSQSGATLFIEPPQTVELNNKINMLIQEEHYEIERILLALTAEVAARADALTENVRRIGHLDAVHAAATFSNDIQGTRPILAEKDAVLDLRDARHPLLIVHFRDIMKVVPTSLELGDTRQGLLITGPNTGGKTIALKTIGLAVLMAQAGLHIAAAEGSTIGLFRHIFADIGDEQSIELSLSTFSSHVRNIIRGLRSADSQTLLLYDEIGAGTDPREGAALAEAIIHYALDKGAKLLVTTHYSQLKTLALDNPEIENASLEFDRETLAPTYRLHIGLPGSSYAIQIARRLGMPAEICDKAAAAVGTGERDLSELIAALQSDLTKLHQDRNELTQRLDKARQLEEYYRSQVESLKNEVEAKRKQGLEDTMRFLDQTRRDVEHLVADIRSSKASGKSVKDFHRKMKVAQQKLGELKATTQPQPELDQSSFAVGDTVEIISFGTVGEVEELLDNDRARVVVNNVRTTVDFRNLRKVSDGTPRGRRPAVKSVARDVAQIESPEIHLLGMTVDEAIDALDKFIGRAVIAGMQQIYVVHGKGTGALRRNLSTWLKQHRDVESIRLGDWGEGGSGVTIVKLRS